MSKEKSDQDKRENKGNKMTPEKLWEFSRNIDKLRRAQEKASQLRHELCIAIQMEYLCKEGLPKKSDFGDKYVGDKKQPCIIITNEEGKEFVYPVADVPHEVRAYILNRYNDPRWGNMRWKLAEYSKLGWLKPYPDYEKEETDENVSGESGLGSAQETESMAS